MIFVGPFIALLISVTDGDTFRANIPIWPDNIKVETAVRIRGIDAPEIYGDCPRERELAQQARNKLAEILGSGQIRLYTVGPDKYSGRVVAEVIVGGTSVGTALVEAGLAHRYEGGTRISWCP